MDINKALDGHARALTLANQRLELLANNVANADTPNFKARDIDFNSAMQAVSEDSVSVNTTSARHISTSGNAAGGNTTKAMYRVPNQPSLDGNTVDSQLESASIADTAVRYQATLTFLNQKISGLRAAITGGR